LGPEAGRFAGDADIAVLVLDRRVDADNFSPAFQAIPADVALDDPLDETGTPNPAEWVGEPVRVVGREDPYRTDVRTAIDTHIRAVSHQTLRIGAVTQSGDSGGPTYLGDPDVHRPIVVGVHRNPLNDARTTDPTIAAWLASLLTGTWPGGGGVYLGPTDVPAAGHADRLPAHDADDLDGDGLVGAHDNCAAASNPDQLDGNLDGVGDACDRDNDGWADEEDNCPEDLNPTQADCDEDGVGDACSPDADGDGIPDDCDSCSGLSNRDQALDCNADAVAVVNRRRAELGLAPVPVRGDACDPVPCPTTHLAEQETPGSVATRISMDRVEVDARQNAPFGSSYRTVFRFCQCRIAEFQDLTGPDGVPDGEIDTFVQTQIVGDDPLSRELCETASNGGCLLNMLEQIHDPTDPVLAAEFPTWRWTTHRGLDPSPDGMPPCPPTGPRPPFCVDSGRTALAPEYPTTYTRYREGDGYVRDRYNRWLLHSEDVSRWVSVGFGDPLRDSIGTGPGLRGAVSGVLWTHAAGSSGAPDPDYPFISDPLVREQASHYWSGRVLAPIEVPPPAPCFEPFVPFLGTDLSCPFCPFSFPHPVIGFPGTGRCLPDLRFPGLFLGGLRIDPGDALELPGLELFAGDPGPWLAAAEVGSWLPRNGLRYVKVTSGNLIERAILELDGVLSEPGGCVPGQCDPVELPNTFPLVAGNEPGAVPEARTSHAETLSARRSALWVVGGTAVSDGRPLDEVWVYELAEDRWCELPLGARPRLGRVHAVTYSAADDVLWVLDETEAEVPRGPGSRRRGRRHREARLTRLDPSVGSGDIVATWPRGPLSSANDRFALATDAEGTLYVVGWRDTAHHHVVLKLGRDAERSLELVGWASNSGRVIDGTVRAGSRGISFYVRRGRRRVLAMGYSPDDLVRSDAGYDRCF